MPAKTRGPSHRPRGHCHRRSISTPLIMGRGRGRPVKTRGPPHVRGKAARIKPISHGSRPRPAHQFFRRWAAARGLPAKTCGPSHGPSGHRHHRSISTPLIMGRGQSRPVKTRGPPHRRGKAAHIKPTSHAPRPGPVHQISSRWTATLPSLLIFQIMGRGLAQPIKFSDHGPRPGPSHFQSSRPVRPGPARTIRT